VKEIPNNADLVLFGSAELIKRGCEIVHGRLLFNQMPPQAFAGDSNT